MQISVCACLHSYSSVNWHPQNCIKRPAAFILDVVNLIRTEDGGI